MEPSTKGMIEIMSHEGICLEPYLDSVGVWTIGVGQTKSDDIDPRTMGKITIQQAIDLFKRKIKPYAKAVDRQGLTLTQYQYDALTSCCYNFGEGNLNKLCHGRSVREIGEAIMLYTKPPEITERRRKEQKLFKTGVYSNTDGKVLVFPVENHHPRYAKGYQIDVRPYFSGTPTKPPTVILPPGPTPPDVPGIPSVIPRSPTGFDDRDPVPQVRSAKPATSTGAKVGGAVVIIAAPVIVASQGYNWLEIGLSAFIAAGLVTVIVLLIRKFRSA